MPKTRWEYRVFSLPDTARLNYWTKIQEWLIDYGRVGWELVSIRWPEATRVRNESSPPDRNTVVVLKRPVIEGEDWEDEERDLWKHGMP